MNQSQHPRCFLDPLIKSRVSVGYHSYIEENGPKRTEDQEFNADEKVDSWKFELSRSLLTLLGPRTFVLCLPEIITP